jgi:hypothetical protein
MVFANQSLVEMLRLYSSIIGNSTPECEAALFKNLKEEANAIEPGSITVDSMTAYEAFLMVEKLHMGNVTVPHLDVAGYDDTTMELSKWDPLNPIDDTNQMPTESATSWRELRYKPPVVDDNMVDDVVMEQVVEELKSINIE